MNTQNNFNNKIKDASLKREQQDFDKKEEIWNCVELELDKKPKRRVLPYWKPLSAVASIILIATIGILVWNSNSKTDENIPTIVNQENNEQPIINDEIVIENEQELVNEEISNETGETNNGWKQDIPEPIAIAPKPPKLEEITEVVNEIELIPESDEMEEIVIVGYRSKKSEHSLSSSVQTINSNTIQQNQNLNTSNGLVGNNSSTNLGYNGNVIVDENASYLALNNTPKGARIDGAGRAFDADGDGILDIYDKSPLEHNSDGSYVSSLNSNKKVVDLSNLQFGYNSNGLLSESMEELDLLAEKMKSSLNLSYVIEAHSDSKGSESYNLHLTQNRAEAIKQYLVSQGIEENRILAIGKGENDPLIDCKLKKCNSEDRKANRRILLVEYSLSNSAKSFDIDSDGVLDHEDACPKHFGEKHNNFNYNGCPEIISDTIIWKPNFIEIDQEDYESFVENQFESPQNEPLSTFSVDVDRASYSNIRRFLNNGQTVPKDAVRIEEMINYFNYETKQPTGKHPIAFTTEYSDAPWNKKHKLLRIGLKGKEIPLAQLPASNLVFLIDVSGSMSDQNKLPLLKSSFKLLLDQLRAEDKVSIVVYAGSAGLVLPPTSGDKKATILEALENLEAGGSTAGGEGIELAYKTAQEHFIHGGNNRVILATDGDFNIGASSNQAMEKLIEEKRKSGIFLTCLGYGMGNYKDSKMEILADKGNGNYAYIDNIQEANKNLVEEFSGTVFTIAKDVKLQIEFNPKNVKAYRLIGYENRKLRPEDFTNDAVDAGEMGAGHTVTALYEIIPTNVNSTFYNETPKLKYSKQEPLNNSYGKELATIKFRYKNPDEDKSKALVQPIQNKSVALNKTSTDFKFATAVAWFGLKLRDSKLITDKETANIVDLAKQGKGKDEEGYRAEFIRLVKTVK